jgi:hypothetical protein
MDIVIQCERVTTDYTTLTIPQSELHQKLKNGDSLKDIVEEYVYNPDYSSLIRENPMDAGSWEIIGVQVEGGV